MLAQRVPVLPSIAMAADMPLFSTGEEVAATGEMATPGWPGSMVTGGGSVTGGVTGGSTGVPENAWISKME
ncbi:hypothetical protein D3C81_1663140 [compost metagenome]